MSAAPIEILVMPPEPPALDEIAVSLGYATAAMCLARCWLAEDMEDETPEPRVSARVLPQLGEAAEKLASAIAGLLAMQASAMVGTARR